MEFLKFPLYRLIFDLPLGFSVFFVICIIIGCDEIEKCMKICIDIKPDSSLGVVIYTSVLIVAGEFLAMAGESVTDLFFDFNPIASKKLMERISPIDSKNDKNLEDYIEYKGFVKVLNKAAGEVSEIHFQWSRTFGGFGILFMFSSIALLSVQFPKFQYILCILIAICLFLLILIIIGHMNPKLYEYIRITCSIGCIILPVFLLIATMISCIILFSFKSKLFVTLSLVLLLLLLSILSFLWSVKYRTFSNRINRNRVIIDIESTTNKNENVNNSSSDN